MAKTIDTDRLLSDWGQEVPQSANDGVDGCIEVRTIGVRVSDDNKYLIITEERIIDLQMVSRLSRLEQFKRQALYVYSVFAQYLDHSIKANFCQHLLQMLIAGTIEVTTDSIGTTFINLPKGKGQAELIRLLISHMTAQKLAAIRDSAGFNTLKYLLIEHLRKQSLPITVNSMSSTLRRAVNKH